ncbi:MAG: Sec-independent protein translocase protein TatB [Alphaproteobacteria bacterium]|nr:Sec-independent protein translocase protein TatB [Alphaproteobacteria bacterium]MCY4231339.1 Sec-independent protein translocase protein TatB [Alphaproteobacteria bacterium]MCY4317771.1 Sec-independent protein translocase protein TatB [Alphaproteobacteria bacterium]
MLDIGWTEMLVIAVIAVVVIGPRDLPGMLKTIGNWVRKARATVRELQTGIEDMAREAELDEVKKSVESATRVDNWLDDKALAKPAASPSVASPPAAAPPGDMPVDPGKPAKLW